MNNKSTFRELLLDPEKKRSEAENELAYLFRDIMLAHGVNPSEWDRRLDMYYRRLYTNSRGEVDLIKVNQEKSNLVRALAKDTLPWKRFNTSLQLMGPESYTIIIELTYRDGRTHTHKVKIRNRLAEMLALQQAIEAHDEDEELDPNQLTLNLDDDDE